MMLNKKTVLGGVFVLALLGTGIYFATSDRGELVEPDEDLSLTESSDHEVSGSRSSASSKNMQKRDPFAKSQPQKSRKIVTITTAEEKAINTFLENSGSLEEFDALDDMVEMQIEQIAGTDLSDEDKAVFEETMRGLFDGKRLKEAYKEYLQENLTTDELMRIAELSADPVMKDEVERNRQLRTPEGQRAFMESMKTQPSEEELKMVQELDRITGKSEATKELMNGTYEGFNKSIRRAMGKADEEISPEEIAANKRFQEETGKSITHAQHMSDVYNMRSRTKEEDKAYRAIATDPAVVKASQGKIAVLRNDISSDRSQKIVEKGLGEQARRMAEEQAEQVANDGDDLEVEE